MRGIRAMLIAAVIAVNALGASASATPALVDLPIPRDYPETGFERADPNKFSEQRASEAANADASEADCNAGIWAACTDLGQAYGRGDGRPQNRPVAELLYRRACDAADGMGCFRLGYLLRATRDDIDQQIAATLFARACRLNVLQACDAEADTLAWGTLGEADPVAAEALRRVTCARGGGNACRTLASLLMERERSLADQDEGRALLDRQCRAADAAACSVAADHWHVLIAPDARERTAEYQELGCAAGDEQMCIARAKEVLALGKGAAQRAAALVFYDRACALNSNECADAAQLRDEPGLSARCDGGDGAACITLGQLLSDRGSALEDRPRAIALLGAACEAGMAEVCYTAAELVLDQTGDAGTPDPVRLDAYFSRACTAGRSEACERLANALADGVLLPKDIPRAAALYAPQCEEGRITACKFFEEQASNDPAAPLMLARANFGPDLTPEEEAEDARLEREARERQRAEDRLRACTTTTVGFEGVSYTDTICVSVTRVVGKGFTVRRGATPWQALLWRPPLLGRQQLTPGQRVLCGGSVIRDGWILTAAHCVNDAHMGGVSVKTGGHRIRLGLTNALGDEGFSYPIIATYPHPNYNPKILAFDIALVQYDTDHGERGSNALAPARIRLDPVPLAERKIETLARVATYGWGLTAYENGVIPDKLRGGRVKLRDPASCTAEIVSFADRKRRVSNPELRFDGPKLRNSLLCADERQGAEGGQACDGDSGGPLISYSDADKVPTLIGVVSGGVKCGTSDRPSRYIRVAHPIVQDWLRKVLPPARPR